MELAEMLGMRPLVARCHDGLGSLYRRANREDMAQEHISTAAGLYGEMGMNFWLEKTATKSH